MTNKGPSFEGPFNGKGTCTPKRTCPVYVSAILPVSNIQVVISIVNPFENLLASRLLEYFHSRTPWHRTLWNAGTSLALREVLEASEAMSQGHLSDTSLRGAVVTALRLLKDDPGMGSSAERAELAKALTLNGEPRNEILFNGLEYEQIQDTLQRATPLYLDRWAEALNIAASPAPERASRAIASHLLDLGFNANYLHRWWSFRLHIQRADIVPLSTLVSEAAVLANQPEKNYTVLIPFPSELKPPKGLLLPNSWVSAADVSKWGQRKWSSNASPSSSTRWASPPYLCA